MLNYKNVKIKGNFIKLPFSLEINIKKGEIIMSELIENFFKFDEVVEEKDLLTILKNSELSQDEVNDIVYKASENGFITVIDYMLKRFKLKESEIVEALCWSCFAKNSDKVFGKIVELTNFDVSYNNNQILMYALSNDCEGQINCESIAKVILKSFNVLLSNDNVDKIYDFILQDTTASYENVAFEIYQKIGDKNRLQRMFELFVYKSYIKVLPKIMVNNSRLDVSNAILYCIEYEDTVMIEILLNYSAPSSKTLLICVKNGLKKFVYELFKRGKYGMSELVDALNSDDGYLMVDFLNNV